MKGEILYRILEGVNAHGAVAVQITKYAIRKDLPKLIFQKGKKTLLDTYVQVTNTILPKDIPNLFTPNKEMVNTLHEDAPIIVAAEYITQEARVQLREKGIGYIDAVGNMYYNGGKTYIHIETNKSGRAKIDKIGDRVFTKTGLKLVYNFLIHPEDINKTYRLIGGIAGVAIDTVGKVIKQLLKEKYLLKADAKKYVWKNREQLFHKWVDEYNRVLRPNLERLTATPIYIDNKWEDATLTDYSYWGGEIAANQIVDNLIVTRGILYTFKDEYRVLRDHEWIPKEDGPIVIYEAFWVQKNPENDPGYVHPILTYADLINTNNPRQIEIAQKIYDERIKPIL